MKFTQLNLDAIIISMRNLIFLIFLFVGCSKAPADWEEKTHNYKLPPELEGHKIIVLGGGWSSTNPLWVIVPPQGLEKPIIIQQNK